MRTCRPWSGAILLACASLFLVTCDGERVGDGHFPTRDRIAIEVRCQEVLFVVSLNDDDDNSNKVRDREEAISPTREDNLRQFTFNEPRAKRVFIAEPVILPDMKPAVGVRVRAYNEQRQPFDFTAIHTVPVIMFLEGIGSASKNKLDIAFEYGYYEDEEHNRTLCGPGARGTVVDLNAEWNVHKGTGSRFHEHRKMLIGGEARASATLTPQIEPAMRWTYDGAGTFDPPNALQSTFTASNTDFTPHDRLDMHSARFVISKYNQDIEAHYPVNLTAARHCIPIDGQTNGWNELVPANEFLSAHGPSWTLIPNFGPKGAEIDYQVLDQFLKSIKDSAWPNRRLSNGRTQNRVLQVKENIRNVLMSPIDPVNQWIRGSLTSADNWTTKNNGMIEDKLRAFLIPKQQFTILVNGQRQFLPSIQTIGGVLMHVAPPGTHQWEVSISGDVPTIVTDNEFSVTTAETQRVPATGNINIKMRSRYVVRTR